MQQLTDKEIARVFALYLGCQVKLEFQQGWNPQPIEELTIEDISRERVLKGELLLTPLSAITDEHAITLGTLIAGRDDKVDAKWVKKNIESFSHASIFLREQLILWGYAVSLYFGINHPCNGKTAIELGIAIEKTAQVANIPN